MTGLHPGQHTSCSSTVFFKWALRMIPLPEEEDRDLVEGAPVEWKSRIRTGASEATVAGLSLILHTV